MHFKTFGDLYAAIQALPLGEVRDELFNLWTTLEESATAEQALAKFDANVGDLSAEAISFYMNWARQK